MISIVTVCGNGIGSSLMLKMKIEEICNELGIAAQIETSDFNGAKGKECDLIVTVEELAQQFDQTTQRVGVVRSYINKKKIKADIAELLQEVSNDKK
ncbi:PTS sugar transporter subunit IIB [Risungbinella massiliensis]|uniref:PTS sugar transporter subunit IIB n=1 Tax=Risungbinella massiliensis TaxID=1329796 RepID=UPI0005CBCAB8|nr:PTS sugar transporter subunit IIB [Risungbinella massiliensis]